MISKRGEGDAFQESWSRRASTRPIPRSTGPAPPPGARVWAVFENGAPARQGGPAADRRRLHRGRDGQVARGREAADGDPVRGVALQGAARATSTSGRSTRRPTRAASRARPTASSAGPPLRATYDAFGSERYVLAFDNKRMREAAAAAPYEFIEIVVNDRKYGGGGIHNLYATVSADNAFTPYVFVHEFGHHFAGLADEYYTSAVALREPGGPPGAVGAERDRGSEGGASGRTSSRRGHAAADAVGEGRRSRPTQQELPGEAPADPRGQAARSRDGGALPRGARAVDGAAARGPARAARWVRSRARCTRPPGYYRPQADCIMFTRDEVGFCAVCRRAIERVIDLYTQGRRPTELTQPTMTRSVPFLLAAVPLAAAWPRSGRRAEGARRARGRAAALPGHVGASAPVRFVLLENGQIYVGGTSESRSGSSRRPSRRPSRSASATCGSCRASAARSRSGRAGARPPDRAQGAAARHGGDGRFADAPAPLKPLAALLASSRRSTTRACSRWKPRAYALRAREGKLPGGCRPWPFEEPLTGLSSRRASCPPTSVHTGRRAPRPLRSAPGDKSWIVTFRPLAPDETP